jgi:hypothetical protein
MLPAQLSGDSARWSSTRPWIIEVMSSEQTRPGTRGKGLRSRLQRLAALSFPARFPIVQFPNVPLALALLLSGIASASQGGVHRYLMAVAYLSFGIWGYEELARGVNWFRRLLGLGFLVLMVIRVARLSS